MNEKGTLPLRLSKMRLDWHQACARVNKVSLKFIWESLVFCLTFQNQPTNNDLIEIIIFFKFIYFFFGNYDIIVPPLINYGEGVVSVSVHKCFMRINFKLLFISGFQNNFYLTFPPFVFFFFCCRHLRWLSKICITMWRKTVATSNYRHEYENQFE